MSEPGSESSSSSCDAHSEGDASKKFGKKIVKRHNTKSNLLDTSEIVDQLRNLSIALQEPIICNGFRKFLVKNFCCENLNFWKEVEQFQQLTDPQEIAKRAKDIYETYVSPRATSEVNLPFHVNEVLQQTFQSKAPITRADVFDVAKHEIFALMQRDSFPRFLSDPIFQQSKQVFEKVRCLSVSSSMDAQTEGEGDTHLTDRDWSLILTGAKEKEINPNSVIVEQGTLNTYLYRLKSGKLSVEKKINGENVVLSTIDKPGVVFGELSVLGSLNATASIVSRDASVVLRVDKEFILSFLMNEPRLAKRFYYNMAKKLANLLQEISSLSSEKKLDSEEAYTSSSSAEAKQDGLLCDRFGIPSNEVLVKQFDCGLDRMVKRNGTVYVFQSYLCFEAKFFGQRTRDIVRIKDITDIHKKPGKNTILLSTDAKKWKFVFKQLPEAAAFLQLVSGLLSVIKDKETEDHDTPIIEESPDGNFLRPEEWNILLGGERDKTMTVAKGDTIIQEGQKYSLICQIVSGSCRIEKEVPGSPEEAVVLGLMHPGELFGEITFLTEGVATASVIAEEDVELYFIDGSFLKDELFASHPQLVVRFYHYLCRILSARIAQREQEGWGRSA